MTGETAHGQVTREHSGGSRAAPHTDDHLTPPAKWGLNKRYGSNTQKGLLIDRFRLQCKLWWRFRQHTNLIILIKLTFYLKSKTSTKLGYVRSSLLCCWNGYVHPVPL